MKLLEDRIRRDGKVFPGDVLKVDCFLNHLIDVPFVSEVTREFYRLYRDEKITKILTVEASGIAVATLTAAHFGVPVLFAKKAATSNLSPDVYTADVYSYTHNKTFQLRVAADYLGPSDRVLLVDDFLARGGALFGLAEICRQAGAFVVGAGVAIEKAYQDGGRKLRESGMRVESLARIASMENGAVTFAD